MLCIHEPVVRDARYPSFWHHNKTLAVLWITICQGNVPAIVHMSLAFYKGMPNYYSEHCAPCGTHSPGQSGIGLTFEYAIRSRSGQDGYFFMRSRQSNAIDGDEEFASGCPTCLSSRSVCLGVLTFLSCLRNAGFPGRIFMNLSQAQITVESSPCL